MLYCTLPNAKRYHVLVCSIQLYLPTGDLSPKQRSLSVSTSLALLGCANALRECEGCVQTAEIADDERREEPDSTRIFGQARIVSTTTVRCRCSVQAPRTAQCRHRQLIFVFFPSQGWFRNQPFARRHPSPFIANATGLS